MSTEHSPSISSVVGGFQASCRPCGWTGTVSSDRVLPWYEVKAHRVKMEDPHEETFPATWEGGHSLIIEYGDCEIWARCQCTKTLGLGRPSTSLDEFGEAWEKHVMTEVSHA